MSMITYAYCIICIGIWDYINLSAKGDKYETALKLGALCPAQIKQTHQYWRLIACNFIHVDFLHVFMNAYCIYYLGSFFEQLFGGAMYAFFVLVVMLSSSLMTYGMTYYRDGRDYTITLGASGVFYGYLGAMIALGLFLRGGFLDLLYSYMYVIVINVAFTLLNRTISKTGHFGGLIGGYLFIYALYLLRVIG